MRSADALEYLKKKDRECVILSHIESILGWDEEILMPEGASTERGEQLSYIALMEHKIKTDETLKEAVASINEEELTPVEKALLREWRIDIERASLVPPRLVTAMAEESNRARGKWVEAKRENNWNLFRPSLQNLVELSKEYASRIGDGSYNTLLSLYERGLTEEKLNPLFSSLETAIHSIMDKIEGKTVDTSFLYRKYDEKRLEEFCTFVSRTMGFDFRRGTFGITAHPFTSTLGEDDVRISNRFSDESVVDPIFSIVHETGHALYEMNASLNKEIRGTRLSQGASMGLHESQSRFWENMMGHSHSFWEYFYPRFKKYMPEFEDIDLDSFVLALNYPHPSAIRVNADELTYTLHIILRYKIESSIFSGALSTDDIPSFWNEESKKIIRYSVKNDSEGCLQDSHWSSAQFGYFPSYALGNIYAAMFLEKLTSDLGGKDRVDNALSSGDFSPLTAWQNENIWKWGAIYESEALIKKVTGSEIKAEPFIHYLEEKFLKIYL